MQAQNISQKKPTKHLDFFLCDHTKKHKKRNLLNKASPLCASSAKSCKILRGNSFTRKQKLGGHKHTQNRKTTKN